MTDQASTPQQSYPEGAADFFAFARDLEYLRSSLDQIGRHADLMGPGGVEAEALAEAVHALLDALENGHDAATSIMLAARALRSATEGLSERYEHRQAADHARYEERVAEEELTRTAECPACGSQPGTKCRTTSPQRHPKPWSHKARWRLARSLNDGARDPDGPATNPASAPDLRRNP